MAKLITKQGPARRLGRRDSRRITKAINRSILSGASKRDTGAVHLNAHRLRLRESATETATNMDDDWRSSVDGSDIGGDRDSVITGGRSSLQGLFDDEPTGDLPWQEGRDLLKYKRG